MFLVGFIMLLACKDNNIDAIYTSIAGVWRCEEIDPQATVKIFNVDIEAVRNYDNSFIISNFHNTGEEYYIRTTVNNNQITLPKQSLGLLVVGGQGDVSSDFKRINLQYTIDEEGLSYTYHAVFNR